MKTDASSNTTATHTVFVVMLSVCFRRCSQDAFSLKYDCYSSIASDGQLKISVCCQCCAMVILSMLASFLSWLMYSSLIVSYLKWELSLLACQSTIFTWIMLLSGARVIIDQVWVVVGRNRNQLTLVFLFPLQCCHQRVNKFADLQTDVFVAKSTSETTCSFEDQHNFSWQENIWFPIPVRVIWLLQLACRNPELGSKAGVVVSQQIAVQLAKSSFRTWRAFPTKLDWVRPPISLEAGKVTFHLYADLGRLNGTQSVDLHHWTTGCFDQHNY